MYYRLEHLASQQVNNINHPIRVFGRLMRWIMSSYLIFLSFYHQKLFTWENNWANGLKINRLGCSTTIPESDRFHFSSISMAYIANAGEGTDSICNWQPIYCHYSQTSSEYNPEINLDFPAYFIWFRKHVQYIRPQFLWVGRLARRQRLSVCYISGLKGLALFAIKYNVNLSHWINVFPPAKRTTNQFLEWDGRILKELSSFKVNFQLDCSTFLKKIGS